LYSAPNCLFFIAFDAFPLIILYTRCHFLF
jgi:hypothetical protein